MHAVHSTRRWALSSMLRRSYPAKLLILHSSGDHVKREDFDQNECSMLIAICSWNTNQTSDQDTGTPQGDTEQPPTTRTPGPTPTPNTTANLRHPDTATSDPTNPVSPNQPTTSTTQTKTTRQSSLNQIGYGIILTSTRINPSRIHRTPYAHAPYAAAGRVPG